MLRLSEIKATMELEKAYGPLRCHRFSYHPEQSFTDPEPDERQDLLKDISEMIHRYHEKQIIPS